MNRIYTFILLLLLAMQVFSQELALRNQYHYNLNYINPAATAEGKCTTFNFSTKSQWAGIKGAPSIQVFSVQMPKQVSRTKRHGLGLNMVRDKNGATQSLSGELIYSYQFMLNDLRKTYVSLGLGGQFGQYTFDERDFTADIYDPIVSYGIEKEINYNALSGIYLYNNDYYLGAGVYNLLPINTRLYQSYGNSQFFLTGILGFNINPKRGDYMLKTSVYSCKGDNIFQIDFNNHFYFKNKIWAGITLRKYTGDFYGTGQNALLFAGYKMERWDFSYAYDLGLNKLQLHHFSSHQISIGYRICPEKYGCPKFSISPGPKKGLFR